MPLYDIEHVVPLTASQQQALAKALTEAHTSRFHAPSYFINIRFIDMHNMPVYRSGVLVKYNRAILRTRQSENRSSEMLNDHCRAVVECWEKCIGIGEEMGLQQCGSWAHYRLVGKQGLRDLWYVI
jgi:phenylpyruvate tautomerase PptA (4-oxalocrotonate tautomerase family)